MKKILYFIVGLLYLLLSTPVRVVEYIIDLGDKTVDNIKFVNKMRKNLKQMNKDAE